MANSFDAEAADVKIDISRDINKTTITVQDNGRGMNAKVLKKVCETLNQPRRDEVEDYYGGLAGNSLANTGLQIVGMLVDEAKVESQVSKGTTITVVRKQKK